ncbi:MAG: RHS repeat-associated core domain-containing protein, partial [Synechococcaceae cyanobacterium SM2_3_1]|nr:RHS repeat-associated core domain-containing protein [Synechococcaceae cyanobacterium SM2_3_1]
MTDPMGNVIRYDYDANGDLVKVTDQEENETDFIYAEPRRPHYLTEIIGSLDRPAVRNEYDDQGRLVRINNASDEFLDIVYDPENSLEIVEDALGNHTTYEYDPRGNIVQQIDALGNKTFAEYDDNNNLIKLTDPNGLISRFTFDQNRNVLSRQAPATVEVEPADLDISHYTFNNSNQLTKLILPTGASFELVYDSKGNRLAIIDSFGSAIESLSYNKFGDILAASYGFGTSTYIRDEFGNVTVSEDPLGIITTMTYDANNRLKTITEEGITSTFDYDNLGRETRSDFGNGIFVEYRYEGDQEDWISLDAPTIGHVERHFTDDGKLESWTLLDSGDLTFTYDEAGRWEQQIDSSGRVLKNDYDPAGRLIKVTNTSTGAVITRRYDAGGRLEEEIDALDNSTLYTYDNKDRLKTVTNGRNKTTTYDYTDTSITITDPLLRKTTVVSSDYSVPIQTQYPDGTKEQAQYLFANNLQEANNYPTLLIDRGGRNRNFGYDSFGRLKTATSLGSSLYTYDYVNDDLSQITSPLGETLNYGYEDARRNLTRIAYGDKRSRVQDYGSDNRLATVTLPSGEIISYTYNSAGQEESRTATQGGTITITYTADGNVDTMTDSTGLTQYQYDSAGRLVGIDYPSGQKIHYDYDVLSRVEKVITQANEIAPESVTSYTYDEVGNLKTVTDPNGGITTMDYDNADRLVERVLPNGVETIYTYDDLDQVESIVHQDSTGLVLASVVYARNPGGEPNKITREDGSYVKLNYDEALRLEEEIYYNPTGALEEQILYTFDIDGKRIMKQTSFDTLTYSYDPGYQLVSATRGTEEETYSFDVDGRVEEITREGSILTLDNDTYDRLVQAGSVNYFYDGMNRRVKSTIPIERNFLVAPSMGSGLDSIHQIIDGSGTAVAEYIYAGMTPLLRLEDNGTVYYLTDAMGTIISLADDNARKVANFDYDGFGNLRSGTGAGIPAETGGDFRFHGQWLEQSTGLYHLRTRDYYPITGRFLSRDPVKPILERPESRDPYQFAYNNPLIYVDPSGQITSLSEINFARVIQNVLRDIRRNAIGEIREA